MSNLSDDRIQFAMMGLVRDPLKIAIEALANNVKSLEVLKANPSLPSRLSDSISMDISNPLTGPDSAFLLATDDLARRSLTDSVAESSSGQDLETLLEHLMNEQKTLRFRVQACMQSTEADNTRASCRRHDFGPVIQAVRSSLLPILKPIRLDDCIMQIIERSRSSFKPDLQDVV
ncbi:hypothetical protein MMC25_008366 [Agyrium rufum]|nr:hypothetical protein [Agyrium rufum]